MFQGSVHKIAKKKKISLRSWRQVFDGDMDSEDESLNFAIPSPKPMEAMRGKRGREYLAATESNCSSAIPPGR